jgi:hypothetical protein
VQAVLRLKQAARAGSFMRSSSTGGNSPTEIDNRLGKFSVETAEHAVARDQSIEVPFDAFCNAT